MTIAMVAGLLWIAPWTAHVCAQEPPDTPEAASEEFTRAGAPVSYAAAKASFKVIYANYGGQEGAHHYIIDVTDLAMHLLSSRGWLKVNNDEMHGDPRPGKSKWLYIEYEVLGRELDYTAKEHSGVTLHQLIKAAGVLPAKK